MNFLIFVIIGALVGWLASLVARTEGALIVVLNIATGVVGGFLGGWILSPMVGAGGITQEGVRVGAVLVSLVGAIILVCIVNLIRRGGVRW